MSRIGRTIPTNRWRLGCAILILLVLPLARALAEPQVFDIPAGSAAKMLQEFGRVSKLQTLSDYELIRNVRTRAVSGKLEPEEAAKSAGVSPIHASRVARRTESATTSMAREVCVQHRGSNRCVISRTRHRYI